MNKKFEYRVSNQPDWTYEGTKETIERVMRTSPSLEVLVDGEWIAADVAFPPPPPDTRENIHDAITEVAYVEGEHIFKESEYAGFLSVGGLEIGFHGMQSIRHTGRVFRIGGRKFKGYVSSQGTFVVSSFDDGPSTIIKVKK